MSNLLRRSVSSPIPLIARFNDLTWGLCPKKCFSLISGISRNVGYARWRGVGWYVDGRSLVTETRCCVATPSERLNCVQLIKACNKPSFSGIRWSAEPRNHDNIVPLTVRFTTVTRAAVADSRRVPTSLLCGSPMNAMLPSVLICNTDPPSWTGGARGYSDSLGRWFLLFCECGSWLLRAPSTYDCCCYLLVISRKLKLLKYSIRCQHFQSQGQGQ